jgi:hypothetical protein
MENKTNTQNNVQQEIDLWGILQKFGQFIRWCIKAMCAVLLFILRKSVQLSFFVLAGVIVGGLLYIFSKPFYSTKMQLNANVADNFFYITLVNENFATENFNDAVDLAHKLNMSESMAKQIMSIRACYGIDLNQDGLPDLVDEKSRYISARDSAKAAKVLRHIFYINAQVYSQEALPYIRKGIMDFINKNEYVIRHNARRLETVNEQVAYLYLQQKRFDSLQHYQYFVKESVKKPTTGQLLVWNEQTQPLYHSDLISLNDQIVEKNSILTLNADPVMIVQDFTETTRRKNSLMFYLKFPVAASLLIGVIFILIWDYRKMLMKLYRGEIRYDMVTTALK